MPRKPRIIIPGMPQHVIQRGNNRDLCFFSTPDYKFYLTSLNDALRSHQCQLHAYVLMTNHVHLLVTPLEPHGISRLMQATGRKFVQHINRIYGRSGTLWEGRYKASVIDSDAWLLTCMRYIELNPVRAGMVAHPGEYRWSSFSANAYGKDNSLITPHSLYLSLGKDKPSYQRAYRELFRGSLDVKQLHEIRDVANQELVLGREEFKDRIEQLTNRQVRRGKDGRPHRSNKNK